MSRSTNEFECLSHVVSSLTAFAHFLFAFVLVFLVNFIVYFCRFFLFFFALYWPLLITLFAFAFALAVGHLKQAERKIWRKFPARPPEKA